jgi:pSer/pThr/pTyr-binding forkhead associated (FHA) protein
MCAVMQSRDHAVLTYSDPGGEHAFALVLDSTSIGRATDRDLVLPESFVSRRHALINRLDGSYELVDQNSFHGTYLNCL